MTNNQTRRLNIPLPRFDDEDIDQEIFLDVIRDYDINLYDNFLAMDEEEQEQVIQIVSDLMTQGSSGSLKSIWQQDFIKVPPTPQEFLEDEYFVGRTARSLYPVWKKELLYVLEPRNDIREWIISGSIGSGKSFAATYAQAYKLAVLSCLRSPQKYYGLAEGTSLIFSVFNLTIDKTELTLYQDLKNLLNSSPFFRETFPLKTVYGSKGEEKEVQMPKGVHLIPGSKAVHAMSTNVFSCILDEMNFRDSKKSATYTEKSEAFNLYTQIHRRIVSRFITVPGILVLISSRQTITDFLEEHIERNRTSPHVHISDYALWETLPPHKFEIYHKTGRTFSMMIGDRSNNRNSRVLKEDEDPPADATIKTGIPIDLLEEAIKDPNGFARDVAGAATFPSEPLISDRQRIVACIDNRRHPFDSESIVLNFKSNTKVQDHLIESMIVWDTGDRGLRPIFHPEKIRVIGLDLSLTGDSTGIAMGCPVTTKVVRTLQRNQKTGELEYKKIPRWIIHYDFFLEINPPEYGTGEIDLEGIQEFVVYLRDSLHFNIWKVSCDGYQSRHMRQNLIKRNFDAVITSVDVDDIAYIDLKQAIIEERALFYNYTPFMEIEYLQHFKNAGRVGSKRKGRVDHLKSKKKDVCDAAAAVAFHCNAYSLREPLVPTEDDIKKLQTGRDKSIKGERVSDMLYHDYVSKSSKGRKTRKIIGIN